MKKEPVYVKRFPGTGYCKDSSSRSCYFKKEGCERPFFLVNTSCCGSNKSFSIFLKVKRLKNRSINSES